MAEEGTGATLSFQTTGVSLEVTQLQSQGISWASIDTTHLGTTGAKTFLRGDLYDPGTVTATFITDPTDLDSLLSSSDSEDITITYPNTDGSTEVSSGFITDLEPGSCEVDGMITGTITIKRTGEITFTDAP